MTDEEVFPTRKPDPPATDVNKLIGDLMGMLHELVGEMKDDDSPPVNLRNMGHCFKTMVSNIVCFMLWLLLKIDGSGHHEMVRTISIRMILKSYLKGVYDDIRDGTLDPFFDYPDRRLNGLSTTVHNAVDKLFGFGRFVYNHRLVVLSLTFGYVGYTLSRYNQLKRDEL